MLISSTDVYAQRGGNLLHFVNSKLAEQQQNQMRLSVPEIGLPKLFIPESLLLFERLGF